MRPHHEANRRQPATGERDRHAPPLIIRTCGPRPPLSDFVGLLWAYEGVDPAHAKERLLPTGTMDLVINLREDRLRIYDPQDRRRLRTYGGGLLVGVQSSFSVIDTTDQASIIGIHVPLHD